MRFVSHSPAFSIQVVPEKVRFGNFGDRIVERESYIAQFNQNDVTDVDLAYAERVFGGNMNGKTVLIDEVTPTPMLARVSVFDTDEEALREGWAGKTHNDGAGNITDFKEYVERFMAERSVNHPDFRMTELLPIEPPWPRYLDFSGTLEQLRDRLVNDGFDLRQVVAYERQSGKRPAVIAMIDREIERQEQEIADAETVPA